MWEKTVLVYLDDGNDYKGRFDYKPLEYWKNYGRKRHYKYLYKGRRFTYHYGYGANQVCCFTNNRWTSTEKARRKANGFLGIKEYKL